MASPPLPLRFLRSASRPFARAFRLPASTRAGSSAPRARVPGWHPGLTRGALAAVFSLALAAAAGAQEIANPDLYAKTLEAAAQALEHYGEVDDREALRRVADVAYRLASESDYREVPFSFHLVDMPEPNAFALPGGQIFITRGMLELGLDDDMLASLLGHEIAHVTRRHGIRMQRRATWLNVLGQAAILGVMIGAPDGPENPYDPYGRTTSRKGSLVQGTAAASLALAELLMRDYSRDFEDEADEEGQRLAAGAGFDPAGAHRLWELMSRRIPQAKEYGYWRTHPFSDQRERAAQARAKELKIQGESAVDDYRRRTQKVLLDYARREKLEPRPPAERPDEEPRLAPRPGERPPPPEPDLGRFLETAALTAWPQGEAAETLRLTRLHRQRARELARGELERDFGALGEAYRAEIEEVRTLTPKSPLLDALEGELAGFQAEARALYPKALDVWNEGVYQTPFLETFLSNYPESPKVPAVALALGDAYSRRGRAADAVEQYLRAARSGAETDAGRRALAGLRNLAPVLDDLTALERLHREIDDPELGELALRRLDEVAPKYAEIANGARYLRRYPQSERAETVRVRLEALAENLYGEVVLYQGVGDHMKALERIQLILTHAPQSRAAEKLRDRAVVEA